jgi:hypothetical protein
VRWEWALLRFLEAHGVDYGVFSDKDLAFSETTRRADMMVFNTHSEYWSEEMIGRLGQYLRGGGKVAFLSGRRGTCPLSEIRETGRVTRRTGRSGAGLISRDF